MQYWDHWFRRIPPKCLANINKVQQKKAPNNKSRLSLKNLTGAFIILLVGYSLAILSFISERIAHTLQTVETAKLSKKKFKRPITTALS